MTHEAVEAQLRAAVARSPSLRAFALLDGARDKRLRPALASSGLQAECLFHGPLPDELAAASPWLVELGPDEHPFTRWLVREGFGASWGVFLTAAEPLASLQRHFRSLLTVELPDRRKVLFRFYDPRVLRVFLPTCTPDELRTVLGPTTELLAEGEEPATFVRFGADAAGSLTQVVVRLGPVAPDAPPAVAEPAPAAAPAAPPGPTDGSIAGEAVVTGAALIADLRALRRRVQDEGLEVNVALAELRRISVLASAGAGAGSPDEQLRLLDPALSQLVRRLEGRRAADGRAIAAGMMSVLVAVKAR